MAEAKLRRGETNRKASLMSTQVSNFLNTRIISSPGPRRGQIALRTYLLTTCIITVLMTSFQANQGNICGAEPIDASSGAQQEFESTVANMIKVRLESGDEIGAAYLRQWLIPSRSDRNTLYLPVGHEEPPPRETDSNVQADSILVQNGQTPITNDSNADGASHDLPAWRSDFRQLREQHAQQLWTRLRSLEKEGKWANIYALACQILFYDPTHKQALNIVGSDGQKGALLAVSCGDKKVEHSEWAGKPSRKARNPHPSLGWRAGAYWQLTTPHFVIFSQVDPIALGTIPSELERILLVWRQLFAPNWLSEKEVSQVVHGHKIRRESVRHEVVIFGSRAEYTDYLKEKEPQVEITLGMYRSMDRRSYFFGNPHLALDTLRHEVTHQLFQEASPARMSAGEERGFWLIEGIALYMESLRNHERYSLVGGWDAPRLQHARYRALLTGSHLPYVELEKMGRATLQQHPDIRGIYSQAAGMTHFFMDYAQGKSRPWLHAKLREVYGLALARSPSLDPATPEAKIDSLYATDFLPVHDHDLEQLQGDEVLSKLCLGRSPLHSESLKHLARCNLSQLQWLDLTECQVAMPDMEWLSKATSLEQLNLTGTLFNDTGMSYLNCPKTLRELDLSQTRVTDAGLTFLAPHKELEVLWLSGTLISDQGLSALHDHEKLRLLGVGNTQVTGPGKSSLLAKRPGLRLED